MDKPRLAVVIPAYNEQETLQSLLRALQEQTVPPSEIIVAVSPKTTDDTAAIATREGARVVRGGLPSVARNAGAAAALSELIVFMDADVLPSDALFLERIREEFSRKGMDLAVPDNWGIDPTLWQRCFFITFNAAIRFGHLIRRPQACGTCIAVRKDMHDSIKGFDERIKFFEDAEYCHRIHERGTTAYFPRRISIRTSTRRLEKDGVLRTLWRAIKVQTLRILGHEVHDLSEVDAHYFDFKE